jgi:arginyl-tRNA synthetase
MLDPRDAFKSILEEGMRRVAPGESGIEIHIERPKNPQHGDLSSNIALQLSKRLRRNPREIAEQFVAATADAVHASGVTESLTIAGAGFLNARIKPAAKLQVVKRVLAQASSYGRAQAGRPQKIQVEFVSANPTGPLHVGHGRQAALGDAIAALLQWQGHAVTREFYYNDAGAQIDKLAFSVQARARGIRPGAPGWPEEAYNGEYIEDIARDFLSGGNDPENLDAIRKFAVQYLRKEQDADLQAFGVKFDVYYLESSLYTEGRVAETVKLLAASGVREGWRALAAHHAEYGDDKTGSSASRTAAMPTSSPMSRITSPSGSAASAGSSTCRAPITTAP